MGAKKMIFRMCDMCRTIHWEHEGCPIEHPKFAPNAKPLLTKKKPS